MFNRANASHTVLETDKGLYDMNTLMTWWNNQDEVESAILYPTALVSSPIKINGYMENESFKLSEVIEGSSYDILYDENNTPCQDINEGEIWVNTSTASDLNIHVGDQVSLLSDQKYIDFKVAHIIVDPIYSSGMFSPSKIWASDGTIDRYFSNNKQIYQVAIRFKNYSEKIELESLRNFKKSLADGFLGYAHTYPNIKNYFTLTSNILSALLVTTAIVMLFVVMLIIRSTINNVILSKYKNIGVMKALGYSSKEIIWVFVLQFLMLLTIEIPFGLLFGYFVRAQLLSTMTSALHIPVSGNVLLPLIITLITLYCVVYLFTFFSAKKAGNVKPVQAIKYGMPENKHYKTSFSITRWSRTPLPLLFVLKQLLGNKKHTIFQVSIFSISVFLAVVVLSISSSFNSKDTAMCYVGMASGDMTLSPDETVSYEQLVSDLRNIKGIKALATYEYFDNCTTYSAMLDDYIALYGITVLGDAEKIGFQIKKGHFPRTANEAIITEYLAYQLNKTSGDYFEIQTKYGPKKYLISGTYETVFNNGQEFILASDLDPIDPVIASDTNIKLNLSGEYSAIEAKIKALYGSSISIEKEDYASKALKKSTQKVTSVLIYVSVVFLVVCGFAIFNWTLMDVKNASRMYGILKANGMNNFKIMSIVLIKSWIITVLGCAIGIFISLLLASPILLFFISFGFKLTSFVITVPWTYALLTSVLFIATSTVSTLLPALKIGKITPRILIIE